MNDVIIVSPHLDAETIDWLRRQYHGLYSGTEAATVAEPRTEADAKRERGWHDTRSDERDGVGRSKVQD